MNIYILLLVYLLLCEFSQEINGAGFPPAPPPPHKREEIRALFNRAIDLEDDYPDGFKDNDTKREAVNTLLATNSGATSTTASSLDPVAAFEQLYNPGAGGKDVDMSEIGSTTLVPATLEPTTKAATTVKETLVLMGAAPEGKELATQTVDSTQASFSSESTIIPHSTESAFTTQLTTQAPMTSTPSSVIPNSLVSTEVPTFGVSSVVPNSEVNTSPVGLPDGFEPDGAFDKIDESKNNSVLIIPTQSENDVVVVDVEDITQIDTVPVESYSNGGKIEDSNVQVSAISRGSVASTMLPTSATSEMTTSKEPGEILSFSTIPVPLDDGSTTVGATVTTPVVATQSTGSPYTNVPTSTQSTTTYAPDPTSRLTTTTQQPGPTRSFVVASGAIHRRTFFRPSKIGTSGNTSPIIKTGVHLEEADYANQGASDSDRQYANKLGYDTQGSHMSQHRYEATPRYSTQQTTPEPITIGYRKRKQILIESDEIGFQGINVERQESEDQGSQAFQPANNFKPEIAQLLLNNGKKGNLIPVLKTVLRPSVSQVNGRPEVSFRKVHYVVFKEAPLKA